ncbi:MAG: ATP-binding protein [Halofilum sp. (in: g-proteobacteria)]|nr:ATP-binding protein [Halofilum sp. (in: g-proteobacteria)]
MPVSRLRSLRLRSMLALVMAGIAIVAAPLVIAIVVGSAYVERLTERSERLVHEAVELTREETALNDGLLQLERNARQFRIVGREELREVFLRRESQLRDTLAGIGRAADDPDVTREIEVLQRMLAEVAGTIAESEPDAPAMEEAVDRFAQMREHAGRIVTATDNAIANELRSLERASARARSFLFWLSATVVPVTILLGGLVGWLILRPIHRLGRAIRSLGDVEPPAPVSVGGPPEIRSLGSELERLRVRLERSEAEKTRFLRHISHELKTPLAAIREGTELMADGSVKHDTAEQREILDILRSSSVELQQLIENLLVVSARDLSQQPEKIRLDKLVDEVVKRYRLALGRADLRVERSVSGGTFSGFRTLIHSALSNLVGNAIRFSPTGGVVRVRLGTTGNRLVIDVTDEGPGIPAAEQPYVFEPFYQGTAPQRPTLRGTGVGLSVVRDCARAHDGSAEVIPEKAGGAHIRVTLRAQHQARWGEGT